MSTRGTHCAVTTLEESASVAEEALEDLLQLVLQRIVVVASSRMAKVVHCMLLVGCAPGTRPPPVSPICVRGADFKSRAPRARAARL
jgi:hypothetical protein